MSEEEKGFVFKDRRKLSQSEEEPTKEQAAPEEPTRVTTEAQEVPPYPPLPEVNFSTFIVSLSTEILFHLGEIPHPESGERQKNLPLAKHAIDTLVMLQEKTRGNLSEEEKKILESMLYDLRMCFIRAS
ncbi:MAG: DUF1844 domain-containing protein [Desulfobacterota bacterium]|jgi:hypothetical protein|nr:DUF1844 domain-containing protein [Thermodesulfobacteriota bacterium]